MRTTAFKKSGPFPVPARFVLLGAGILAVALAAFNLYHELHAGEVSRFYAVIAALIGLVWLGAVLTGFNGWRSGVFIAGLIAFVQFAVIASTHFVIGPGAMAVFVGHEGLPVATADMALIPACMLVIMGAAGCWTNPRGRTRELTMLPLALAALIGSILVILQATDDLHRSDFGTANAEDGVFAAAILASLWLAGGLWISRVRRTGALLIAIATFGVWYSFVTLHVLPGGTTVSRIASQSGIGWALVDAATGVLAAASFLISVGVLVLSVIRHRRPAIAPASKIPRRA